MSRVLPNASLLKVMNHFLSLVAKKKEILRTSMRRAIFFKLCASNTKRNLLIKAFC